MDADTEAEGGIAPDASGEPAEQPAEAAAPAPQQPQGEDPALIAAQREERARRRLRQTARDMILSMLVVAAGVLVLWLPFHRSTPDPVKTVDPTSVIVGARATETWPVLAPVGLPATWRCTSARVDTALDGQDVVHLGWLTPSTTSAAIDQSATKELTFVREVTVDAQPAGSAQIDGATWQKLETTDGKRRAFVREADGATYVVSGGASWADLTTFADSLVAG